MSKRQYRRTLVSKSLLWDILQRVDMPLQAYTDPDHVDYELAQEIVKLSKTCKIHKNSYGELKLWWCGPKKIDCLKTIRAYTGYGLQQAKYASEQSGIVLKEGPVSELMAFYQHLLSIGATAEINYIKRNK